MKPFFLQYKSITISWFMAFAIVLVGISSFIVRAMAKEYGVDKEKVEDIFFTLTIGGFIGARISYVLTHFNLYKDNISLIFKISHYNLSLIGGIIIGVLILLILSKSYSMDFYQLLEIFTIPLYFSMSIGIWLVIFDKFLIPFNISNNPIKILYISIIFLLGMVVQLFFSKKKENKYITIIILSTVIFLYYVI